MAVETESQYQSCQTGICQNDCVQHVPANLAGQKFLEFGQNLQQFARGKTQYL
jgi:hypothetical protein